MINVEEQKTRSDSLLSYYKKLTAIHHEDVYEDVFAEGSVRQILEDVPAVFAYEREWDGRAVTVVVNFKKGPQEVQGTKAEVLLNNHKTLCAKDGKLMLDPYQEVVFDGKI